ncbi:MAG: type III-A CRISPR-associated RAMP protein Csm4 [Candidatus Ratteibacteria bacterium]
MKTFKIFKLKFKSSFHTGERENIYEKTDFIIHSDTFFSAFCFNFLLLYGENELGGLLNKFKNGNPPFLISSLFPFRNEELYFPVLLNQMPKDKQMKKILYIEKNGFEKLLEGEKIENLKDYKFIYKNGLLAGEKDYNNEKNKVWDILENPRVGLSRLSSHPGESYFHFGEVFYKEDCGLFFLVEFKEKEIEKKFIPTLRLMQDEGIGGDRTVGKGHFEINGIEEIKINEPEGKNCVILSLYYPTETEISDLKDGYYEIVERKGYIYSPYIKSLRRKSIKMFKEGSVFPGVKKGTLIDITPEIFNKHKIYRYGFAFYFKCKEVKNEN